MKKTIIYPIRIAFLLLFVVLVQAGKMNLWLALFGITVVGALFFGRFFCGSICPMNTLMVPVDWISKKLGMKQRNVPKLFQNQVGAILLLVLSLAILLVSRKVLQKNVPILFLFLGISVLVTLFYKPEFFHNHLCPFGLVQKLTGRFAVCSKRASEESCISCKKCEKVCPAAAISFTEDKKKAVIQAALCHQCQNCTTVCPTAAIAYGRRG